MADAIREAQRALSDQLDKEGFNFAELRERFHRIENCRLDGPVLSFELERHPADWTSLQHYRFDTATGEITFHDEVVIGLATTGESLVAKELETSFVVAGIDGLDDCSSVDEVRQLAEKLAHENLPFLSETWSCRPDEVENASEEIRQQWDKARLEAIAAYPAAFVKRAVKEFQKHD